MFNPRTFENARPDGFPVLEIVEEPADEGSRAEPRRLFVPLRRTDLAGEVVGPVATFRLRQRFGFYAVQLAKPIEAVYRFPLPGDAAVTGVRVQFGDVEITAALAERAAAEATYQTARQEGRQAALLTRESPDVFTLQVAGITPDEEVTIETRFAQLARPEGRGWSLRVPLTTAPRFVRSDEQGAAHAHGQPLAVLRDPGHRFSLDLTVDGAERIASPTHALDVQATEGRARVRLRDGEVLPDRDCVLTWQPPGAADRPTLQVLRHDDPSGDASHFLAMVVPPAEQEPRTTVPREIILLIDHSGSMSGAKWEAADWAVQNVLASLTPSDTFNLGLFHTTTRWFARQPVQGDERAVRQAREFLLRHRDSGGTELGVALEQALGQPRSDGARARHVLIVTDAQVSDAGRVLALVEREAGRPARRRVDVLCIDAAPNSGLANELAERGGGIARFLTSDPAENDIASALDEVLADWSALVLRDLTLVIDRDGVQAAGRRVTAEPGSGAIDLGDLPAGRAVWVAGRITRRPGGRSGEPPTFRLLSGGVEIASSAGGASPAEADGAAAGDGYAPIPALFGARRVLDLELAQTSGIDPVERLRQLGYEPADVLGRPDAAPDPALYPENARQRTTDALHDLLVRESLRYGIACSATAFVATRQEAGERVAETVAVGSALAHGWSSDFLMLRASAPMAPPSGALPMTSPTSAIPMAPLAAPPPDADAWTRFSQAMSDRSGPLDRARRRLRRVREDDTRRPFDAAQAPPAAWGQDDDLAPARSGGQTVVFAGLPSFADGVAVLFDSRDAPGRLPSLERLTRLMVRLGDGSSAVSVDPDLTLELFVDDLTVARARVRLADVLRQGGERPLNVRCGSGQVVRLVLRDPNGSWAAGAPRLEVALG